MNRNKAIVQTHATNGHYVILDYYTILDEQSIWKIRARRERLDSCFSLRLQIISTMVQFITQLERSGCNTSGLCGFPDIR